MKVHDIINKLRNGSKIAVIHSLSGELFINDIDVEKVRNNEVYQKEYKCREVYAIEIENEVLNIEII